MVRLVLLVLGGFVIGIGVTAGAAYLLEPPPGAVGTAAGDEPAPEIDGAGGMHSGGGAESGETGGAGATTGARSDGTAGAVPAGTAGGPAAGTVRPTEPASRGGAPPTGRVERTAVGQAGDARTGAGQVGEARAGAGRGGDGPAQSGVAAALDTISQRLANIFGAMEPSDAARVLERLDDAEVRLILFHLSDRKVAAILGQLEPTRAARLSQGAMAEGGARQ